jgi:hypothetical protein
MAFRIVRRSVGIAGESNNEHTPQLPPVFIVDFIGVKYQYRQVALIARTRASSRFLGDARSSRVSVIF